MLREATPFENNRQFWPLLDRTQPDPSLNAEDVSPLSRWTALPIDSPQLRGLAAAARLAAPRRAVLLRAQLLQPHPPHRFAQPRRPGRAGREHSLSLAVPRRPDRRARAEPAGAGRDHRRRDRGLRHRRDQHHHHRSRPAARSEARRNLRRAGRIFRAGFSDQSGARRAGAAAADLADQDPRPHLRPRRRADPRQPQPLRPRRRAALRTAAAVGREARHRRAHDDRDPHLAQSRRPAALSRTRTRERQRLSGGRAGAERPEEQHGARQRPRRGDRLGRGAGAALPRHPWRADALDPGRRHRPDGDRRAAGDPEGRRRRRPRS